MPGTSAGALPSTVEVPLPVAVSLAVYGWESCSTVWSGHGRPGSVLVIGEEAGQASTPCAADLGEQPGSGYRGTTVIVHRSPGALLSRPSAVTIEQSSISANAT